MDNSGVQLSKLVSHALRHEPWLYELELDDEGWVSVDALLAAVRSRGGPWENIGRQDLTDMIESATKQRHELEGDRIRALYGHSVPSKISKVSARPPAILFHGTSPEAWAKIQFVGLRAMGRQYVHLSVDRDTAEQVGRRKSAEPVIITVDAGKANQDGTRFLLGNDRVWLAEAVPVDYLSVQPTPPRH